MPAMLAVPVSKPVPAAHPAPDAPAVTRRARWAALAAFCLVALINVGMYDENLRSIIVAGDRLEHARRWTAPENPQPGLLQPFADKAPPVQFDPDSYEWINQVQAQIARGEWRTRHVDADNAPAGREMHWSSSFAWWLLLVGGITSLCTGQPWAQGVAASAAWANPLLFGLFLVALVLVIQKRAGVWTAGALAVTLAAMPSAEWDFSYARPDHHGLHLIAYIGMFLSALAGGLGWVRAVGPAAVGPADELFLRQAATCRQARFWMAVSGVFGGMGLWIGATQQMFVIGAMGAGAALGALLCARRPAPGDGARYAPELWRRWARAGALTSLGFYLLEYFPNHLGMRLEVNHPLYALAWLGGGEIICAVGRCRIGGRLCWRESLRGALVGLPLVALLPLATLFGPRSWYCLTSPLLLRLVQTVAEGRPLLEKVTVEGVQKLWWEFTVLPLALPLGVLALWRLRKTDAPQLRAALLTGLFTAGICVAWAIAQRRWAGFAEVSLGLLAVAILPSAWGWRGRWLPVGTLALALPVWLAFWQTQAVAFDEPPLVNARKMMAEQMVTKEMAWTIRRYADEQGQRAPVVMAQPGFVPGLNYFGGTRGIGSLYWENMDGVATVAGFYSDNDGQTAKRIAREHQLDYVMCVATPVFVRQMQWLGYGNKSTEGALKTLAYRLSNPLHPEAAPDWLEPLPLVDAPVCVEHGLRLYRVRRDRL